MSFFHEHKSIAILDLGRQLMSTQWKLALVHQPTKNDHDRLLSKMMLGGFMKYFRFDLGWSFGAVETSFRLDP